MGKEIPDADWEVIKKHDQKDINRRFLHEESQTLKKRDWRETIGLIIIVLLLLIPSYYLRPPVMNAVQSFWFMGGFPFLLMFLGNVLSNKYGKKIIKIGKINFYYGTQIVLVSLFLVLLIFVYITEPDNPSQAVVIVAFVGGVSAIYGYGGGKIFSEKLSFIKAAPDDVKNFEYVYLSHPAQIEKFMKFLYDYIGKVRKVSETLYESKTGEILDLGNYIRLGIHIFDDSKNQMIGLFAFKENGKFIYQDPHCKNIQTEISMLFENVWNFKQLDNDDAKKILRDNCVDLLTEYIEPSSLRIFYDEHKREVFTSLTFIVVLVGFYIFNIPNKFTAILAKPFSQQLLVALIPVLVYALFDYYIKTHKK